MDVIQIQQVLHFLRGHSSSISYSAKIIQTKTHAVK